MFENRPVLAKDFPMRPHRMQLQKVVVGAQHAMVLVGPENGCVVDYVRYRYEVGITTAARTVKLVRVANGTAASGSGTDMTKSSLATSTGDGFDTKVQEFVMDPLNNFLQKGDVMVMRYSAASLAGLDRPQVEIGYRPL